MSNYYLEFNSLEELARKIDWEGGFEEYFVYYNDKPENIHVDGEPLPLHVVEAAHHLKAAFEILNDYFPGEDEW
jgi:hypothetical protein